MAEDTIVAIATPQGRAGIGVVRMSGASALEIVSRLIRLPQFPPQTQRATRGDFVDPCSGAALDQVVVTYFRQPRSYTGEEVVEISCHGAPVVLKYLLECSTTSGARLAEPGEFTMRAFLNGRIDLTQAEAIRDLIESRTLYQARVAAQQAGGAVSTRLAPHKQALVELIAGLEAGIDFAEDDVPVSDWEEIVSRIDAVQLALARMAQGYEFGRIIREGLSLAILGRPNVGKSSLFNRLLNEERAIVTATPGTTRDLVSETANMGGVPLRLVDTAGIRDTADQVERIGVERSLQALADSDLRLLVVDGSAGWAEEDERLLQRARSLGRVLVALNKCDLIGATEVAQSRANHVSMAVPHLSSPRATLDNNRSWQETHNSNGNSPRADSAGATAGAKKHGRGLNYLPRGGDADTARSQSGASFESVCSNQLDIVWTSALTGEGIPKLQELILSAIAPGRELGLESEVITNLRHHDCIQRAIGSLLKAREAATQHIPHEMLLLDVYDALHALDAVTGATTTDDLLDVIFSTFCVGK
jgi:tRNA modification GTPase